MILPTISLWQPYASLIFARVKRFETRDFRPPAKYIGGDIGIHAAKRPHSQCGVSEGLDALSRETFGADYPTALPRGAFLGSVRLVSVHTVESMRDDISEEDWLAGNWEDGRFCWLLDDENYCPFPMKGNQSWWGVAV